MSQELFVSVNQLVEMSDAKGASYDHIVIESSGISEPKSVRSVFQDAESYGMKLMEQVIFAASVARFLRSIRSIWVHGASSYTLLNTQAIHGWSVD